MVKYKASGIMGTKVIEAKTLRDASNKLFKIGFKYRILERVHSKRFKR